MEPRGVQDWFRALGRELGPDGLALLTPPGFAAAFAKYLLAPERERPAEDLEARDPEAVGLWVEGIRAVAKHYFRWRVTGLENVPAEGPALLVGNHNGGIMVCDSGMTLAAIYDHQGPERRLYSLSHDILHSNPPMRRVAARIGALRAGHGGAEKALREGHLVLVYPGSDLDAARPFTQRHKIELGGRKGFLKLALRERVPIVPVVSVGTHEQFVVLTRGDRLARALGVHKRMRVAVLPIVLCVPWGITLGYVPYLPLPAQTSIHFGPALRWPELGPADAEDPEVLARCYAEVEAAMQGHLDGLARGRRYLLG